MKVKCSVIEDLLPLYLDGVCSEESKAMVEEHLCECAQCNDKYDRQKDELMFTDKFIKENLKSKEPFKKIRRQHILKLVVTLVLIPFFFLSFIEIRGDGVGFSALYGRYKTEHFLSYLEKGDFSSASMYIGFEGGIYQTINDKNVAQKQWIDNMQKLKNEGLEIISHRKNDISTDDRFTSGEVIISTRYEDTVYDFRLFISTNKGKVEPGVLSYSVNYQANGIPEIHKMLMEKITRSISTYNPG